MKSYLMLKLYTEVDEKKKSFFFCPYFLLVVSTLRCENSPADHLPSFFFFFECVGVQHGSARNAKWNKKKRKRKRKGCFSLPLSLCTADGSDGRRQCTL